MNCLKCSDTGLTLNDPAYWPQEGHVWTPCTCDMGLAWRELRAAQALPDDDTRCSYGVEGCDSGERHAENLCERHYADMMSAGVDFAESILGDA